jgi:hypothetical protein
VNAKRRTFPAARKLALLLVVVGLALLASACTRSSAPRTEPTLFPNNPGPTLPPFAIPETITDTPPVIVDTPVITDTPALPTPEIVAEVAPPPQMFLPMLQTSQRMTTPTPSDGTQGVVIQMQVSPPPLILGSTLTVVAYAGELGMPQYELFVVDQGVTEPRPMVRTNFENQVEMLDGTSQILEVVSVRGAADRAEFALRAKALGSTVIYVGANGELSGGPEGPFFWGTGSSEPLVITVTEQ